MRRFWFEPRGPVAIGQDIEVDADLFHHIVDVCRFEVGDQFELLIANLAWRAEILTLQRRSLICRLFEKRELPAPEEPHLHVALAVPRPGKVDWVVEKFVELGVSSLNLMTSQYSFLRSASELSSSKMQRWEKLIRAATEQSGRGDLMTMASVTSFDDVVAHFNPDPWRLGLMAYEGGGLPHLRAVLRGGPRRKYKEIWLLVGSEGGFSGAEVEQAVRQGYQAISLGDQVLRVETACVALASILKYEFADSSVPT